MPKIMKRNLDAASKECAWMSSSAGQPVILYHKCLSRPFIRGFGQLGAGTRRDTRLPEEGDGGTSTEIVGSFPDTRSPGRLQSRRHSGERDARRSIVLPTYGWGAAVISKRHEKEKKKAKAGKVTASRLWTGQGARVSAGNIFVSSWHFSPARRRRWRWRSG